jgi:ABC-2 type transport system ATP-binding protein
MIRVEGLWKRFGTRVAVAGISFEATPGEIIGLLGPNGAGKTTTLRMITGVLEPDEGRVSLAGRDIWADRQSAQARLGYLPEGAPLWGELVPRDYLDFLASAHGLKGTARREALDTVIADTELEAVLRRPVETLSKGLRRRVALAGALLHNPDILILDEPTDGLDPTQKRGIRRVLQNRAQGRVVLLSTHLLDEVEAICTRVLVIHRGQILADESPTAFAARTPSGRLDDAFHALTLTENAA